MRLLLKPATRGKSGFMETSPGISPEQVLSKSHHAVKTRQCSSQPVSKVPHSPSTDRWLARTPWPESSLSPEHSKTTVSNRLLERVSILFSKMSNQGLPTGHLTKPGLLTWTSGKARPWELPARRMLSICWNTHYSLLSSTELHTPMWPAWVLKVFVPKSAASTEDLSHPFPTHSSTEKLWDILIRCIVWRKKKV